MTTKFMPESVAGPGTSSRGERARVQAPNVAHIGTLVGFDEDGQPIVDFQANPSLNPLRARCCVELSPGDLGREVVLWFEAGDFARPLVMGCVRTSARSVPSPGGDVEVDIASIIANAVGDDVRVNAVQSLTLRCGQASITLTREGRVLLNGTYVETRASGTNRIQGGSVRIN